VVDKTRENMKMKLRHILFGHNKRREEEIDVIFQDKHEMKMRIIVPYFVIIMSTDRQTYREKINN